MSDLSLYAHYTSLELRRHDHGVLEIVMNGAGAKQERTRNRRCQYASRTSGYLA